MESNRAMNIASVSTLVKLGLMDQLNAIRTIIDMADPSELNSLDSQVSSMIEERRTKIRRRVKRTRLKGLEAWHLTCGDREIIAKSSCPRHVWKVYEVKRTMTGKYKQGPMLQKISVCDGVDGIVWQLAIGQL